MSSTTSYHIVIADDERGMRGLLARVVARAFSSVRITVVADGLEALTIVTSDPPDLLVTNNHMPALSGLELIRAVRAQGLATPIVMVSSDAGLSAMALAAGANAFVVKPFTISALTAVLTHLLPP
jgi:two-component system chemotaxis response regulator CheY